MAVNVKMGVDIGGFTSGIKQGQQILKGLNAEMKASEAEFKATGNAEQLLTNKTKTLNSQIQVQKGIVNQAEKALKAMTDAGVDPADAAYQKLYATMMNATAGMNNAQAELNALGESAIGAAAGADQLTTSVNNIGKKISLDQVISGIDKITSGLENAAKKAIKLGEDLFNSITEAAGWADDTATQAEMFGIDIDTFQRMQKLVTNGMDTTVESMLKSQKKLRKGIGEESKATMEALEELGLAITSGKDATAHLVTADQTELFWKAGKAIMALTDDFAQEAKAQALFGRSWEELRPLFNKYQNAEEYAAALQDVEVVSAESVENLATLNDKLGELEGNFNTLKTEVMGQLAPALTGAAEALNGVLTTVLDYLKTEGGQQLLESLGTAVSDLFTDLSKIDPKDVVNNFTSIFNGLVGGLKWLIDNKDTVIGALEAIVVGWAGLKITGGVLTIIKFVDGLKTLGLIGGGDGQQSTGTTGESTGTTGTTGTIGNIMFDTKVGQAAATSMVLGEAWRLIENGEVFNNSSLSEEDQIRTWVSEQVKDGFIDASKSDELTEKNLKMFEALKEYGKDADVPVSVEPETEDDAAEDIAKQVGPVVVPVQLSYGGSGAGGGGGMVDVLSQWYRPTMYANGIHSVPYDGMLARLHKGERVVPAREVSSRNYSSNLYVESMIMNNGTDAAGLAAAMAAAQRRQMSGYGS